MNVCVLYIPLEERGHSLYFMNLDKIPDDSSFKKAVLADIEWNKKEEEWNREWQRKKSEGTLAPDDDYPFLCVAEKRFGLDKDGNIIDDNNDTWLSDEPWYEEAQLSFPCQIDAEAEVYY